MGKINKKIISLLMAVVLTVGLAMPAFGGEATKESKTVTVGESGKEEKAEEKAEVAGRSGASVIAADYPLNLKDGAFLLTPNTSLNCVELSDKKTYVIDYLGEFSIKYTKNQSTNGWFFVFINDEDVDIGSIVQLGSSEEVSGNIEKQFIELKGQDLLGYGTHCLIIMTAARGDSVNLYVTYDAVSGEFGKADYSVNPVGTGITATLKYGDPANTNAVVGEWIVTLLGATSAEDKIVGSFSSEDEFQNFIQYSGDDKLANGDYTVELKVAGETVNGGDIPPDYVTNGSTKFRVEFPDPKVEIDKGINPTSIVVKKLLTDSTYEWKVTNTQGQIMTGLSGSGSVTDDSTALDFDTYKILAAGEYKVSITEKSASGDEATTESEFSIVNPLTSAAVDKDKNPLAGTGTKKMGDTESTIEWYITDSDNKPISGASGSGLSVADTEFKKLAEGSYKLKFEETSAYNGVVHESEAAFTIENPLTSAVVDRDENPLLGTGEKKMDGAESAVTWRIIDNDDVEVASGDGITVAKDVFKNLYEGSYTLEFTEISEYNGEKDVQTTTFEIVNPQTSAAVDRPVNPKTSTGGKKLPDDQSAVTWEIKDSNNLVVGSGTGTVVGVEHFNVLSEGSYTIEYTETSIYNDATDTKGTSFEIVNPLTSSSVDRGEDPTSGNGGKNLTGDDSMVTWEIKDKDDKVVKSGSGQTVGEAAFIDLPEGSYTMEFTETSKYHADGRFDKKVFPFIVKEPKTNTHISGSVGTAGTIYNPTEITGSKKQPDSSLVWAITDKAGNVVQTGNGDKVPTNIITGLLAGRYSVGFLETTTTGKTHKSSGDFVVASPAPETVINKPENPDIITGTLKNDGWDISWEIKDESGKVIASGSDNTVPKAEIGKLPDGKYSVTFFETCPGLSTLTDSDTKAFTIKKATVPPVTPGGGNSGGGWSSSSSSGGTSRADVSPNLTRITAGVTSPEAGVVISPTGKAPIDGEEPNKALNPQTGDDGIEQNLLYVLYAVLGVAVVLLIGITLLGKKKRRDDR